MNTTLAKTTQWLKETIKYLGVSQEELALAAGMSKSSVSRALNGK